LTSHKKGSIHWYCDDWNVKSIEIFRLVFTIQKNAEFRDELEKMKY